MKSFQTDVKSTNDIIKAQTLFQAGYEASNALHSLEYLTETLQLSSDDFSDLRSRLLTPNSASPASKLNQF